MKRRWAYQGWCKHCVGQARPQGWNGYGAWQKCDRREWWTHKNEAAELLHQLSGTPRFGKHRLHLWASLTERPTLSAVMCCKLYMCIDKLPPEERKLIKNFFDLVVKKPEIIPYSYEGKNLLALCKTKGLITWERKNYIENSRKIISLCRIVSTNLGCRQERSSSTVICST